VPALDAGGKERFSIGLSLEIQYRKVIELKRGISIL
jgi:hypothetical protein